MPRARNGSAAARSGGRKGGFGEWWCHFAHDSITWPVHGYYQCRICYRVFAVPWSEPGQALRARAAGSREVSRPETVIAS